MIAQFVQRTVNQDVCAVYKSTTFRLRCKVRGELANYVYAQLVYCSTSYGTVRRLNSIVENCVVVVLSYTLGQLWSIAQIYTATYLYSGGTYSEAIRSCNI